MFEEVSKTERECSSENESIPPRKLGSCQHPNTTSRDACEQERRHTTQNRIWNGEEDPENPRNWLRARKLFVVANVAFCSFVVYGTAPIWTPSTEAFMAEYGTGHEYTSLGLSLFV